MNGNSAYSNSNSFGLAGGGKLPWMFERLVCKFPD